ncbi:hypothetical protein NEOLEDRAFT_972733 [Neolentinus lepideus HHB14362 ss-1]|uniref:Uncharacterized protein n=1 Tax=Neolentinus lepideus HHB14362 ss-1 TaxID=1314782 RepID=A0A165N9Y7_9AGAM|nr:hypothetical protein NEOLEDRAFT_972733 [Neolentinus lepideus HHB14362 ss-1]
MAQLNCPKVHQGAYAPPRHTFAPSFLLSGRRDVSEALLAYGTLLFFAFAADYGQEDGMPVHFCRLGHLTQHGPAVWKK